MKNIVFLLLLFISLYAEGKVNFTPFIDAQLKLVYSMSEANITKEKIKKIVYLQEESYNKALDVLMINKNKYIEAPEFYDKEIFSLKKIMSINKRVGNHKAYLRDEVKLKSYQLVRAQNIMFKEVLVALDTENITLFEESLNQIVGKNQLLLNTMFTKNYDFVFEIPQTALTIKKLQHNVQELYALRDVNADMINNLYKMQNKMYRLNKYTKYHIISLVIAINNAEIVTHLNDVLKDYGLSVVKIVFILALSILIYFFRKIADITLQRYVLTLEIFNQYSKDIMNRLYKPFDYLVLVINANMIIYVYNDFSSLETVTKLFNMIYGTFFTFIIYKILNTIATIKLSEINKENSIKNEMINVGIKIVNFVILIMGLLIILYYAGVNLTAVLSGLGIGGFAVAFAAKDTISNFFGTLSILFSNVFSQGDWVKVGDNEGVVVELGLRVTTLRTFDNALIAIPNGTFATMEVKNWNRRTLGRRIKMSLGIKYDSKSSDIKNAIAEIRVMLDKHPGIATENTKYTYKKINAPKLISKDDHQGIKKTLLVYLDEFGPSSMNILVYCFSKSVNWQEWLEIKEDVMHKIMEIFEKNSLEFAFPSLSVYHENTPPSQ